MSRLAATRHLPSQEVPDHHTAEAACTRRAVSATAPSAHTSPYAAPGHDDLEGCPAAEDAELVISELVTNAVLHSRSRHGMLTVHSERYPRYAWLEVTDAGGDWQPGVDDDGGRGLAIVAALTAEWGVDGDARSRTVWARIEW